MRPDTLRAVAGLLVACALLGARSATPPTGDAGEPSAIHLDHPSTIPFDSPSGLVIMTGRINDRAPVRLLLDTGDPSGLTLDIRTARLLDLPLGERAPARATGVVGSERTTLYRAQVRSLSIGGLRAFDLGIRTAPDALLVSRTIGVGVDGFVGVDLLRDLRVAIDYPARRITFDRPSAPDPRAIPMRLEGSRIVVEVVLDGSARRAMILDTAAETTMVSDSDLELTRPAPAARTTQIVDSSGRAVRVPVRILGTLRIGGTVLEQVPVVPYDVGRPGSDLLTGVPSAVSGIIGSDVLSRQVVVLDFPNARATFVPGEP